MVSILGGLVGGLVATIVMTAFMMMLGDDSPPPPSAFWAKYVGNGPPEDYMMQGMVLHLLYGIVMGGVFAALALALGFISVATLTSGLLWGLAWGVVLFVVGAVFWLNIVLDMDAEMRQVGMFLFFHLVYGAVLGAWVGFGFLG